MQLSRLAYTDTLTSGVLFAQSYTHDPVGVLSTTTEAGLGTDTYGYDPRERLTTDALSGSSPSSRGWGYDGATAIVTSTVTLGTRTPVTTTRSYNAADELLSLVAAQGGPPTQNLSFTYSTTGNRVSQSDTVSGQSTTYRYDQADRLTNLGAYWTYSYNGDGLRTMKNGLGPITLFTWDVGAGLPQLLSDGTASYIYGPGGRLLEQVQGGNAYYYVSDRLGSVRQMILGRHAAGQLPV